MSKPVNPAEPTIEDYKKYTRELKLKIKRLQDKNKELVEENVSLRSGPGRPRLGQPAGALAERLNFALSLNSKVIRAQVVLASAGRLEKHPSPQEVQEAVATRRSQRPNIESWKSQS